TWSDEYQRPHCFYPRSIDCTAACVRASRLRDSAPIGSILLWPRAALRVALQKSKNPTEMNPVGFLVLATSYSRTAYRRTTIGAAAFHFRVRNGNGWSHCARVTRVRNRTSISLLGSDAIARPNLWGQVRRLRLIALPNVKKNNQQSAAADPLTSTYRSSFRLRTADGTTELRFVLRSFDLHCSPSP